MMTTKMMKRTAVAALVGIVSWGAAGAAEVSASALRAEQSIERTAFTNAGERSEIQQLAWGGGRDRDRDRDRRERRDRDRRDDRRESRSEKKYSRGSINTAIIAGAVIGAIIAKNT